MSERYEDKEEATCHDIENVAPEDNLAVVIKRGDIAHLM
jgi:hypothetical protein